MKHMIKGLIATEKHQAKREAKKRAMTCHLRRDRAMNAAGQYAAMAQMQRQATPLEQCAYMQAQMSGFRAVHPQAPFYGHMGSYLSWRPW